MKKNKFFEEEVVKEEVLDEIEIKLNSLLNVVDIDDITGEKNTDSCHLNRLAQFEIIKLMDLIKKL